MKLDELFVLREANTALTSVVAARRVNHLVLNEDGLVNGFNGSNNLVVVKHEVLKAFFLESSSSSGFFFLAQAWPGLTGCGNGCFETLFLMK